MKLPDGPKTPSWLQLLQWVADPLNYMETAFQRYGDVFTVRWGSIYPEAVFISNPQAIQEIFTADPKLFDSGRGNGLGKVFVGEHSIMKLVLATILSNYQLALVDNRPVKPRRRAFFLAPAAGFKMVMTGRRVGEGQLNEPVGSSV